MPGTYSTVIKKSLCTWWLQYRKLQVMFKVSPAGLQTFIDTPNCVSEDRVQYSTVRVQYSTVHIPNVLCDCYLFWMFFCTVTIRCRETFRSTNLSSMTVLCLLCSFGTEVQGLMPEETPAMPDFRLLPWSGRKNALLGDISHRKFVIPYGRFGKTYR
jgi:hypothetical protein